MAEDKIIVRSVYRKPLSKMVGQNIDIPPELMKKASKIILEAIRKEIKNDAAKHNAMSRLKGQPIPIPNSKEFVLSFKVQNNGNKIEISSTWPFVDVFLEGQNRHAMTWLTKVAGVDKVPMIQPNGVVLIRTAPLSSDKAWIHPGFLKYNFLNRGVEKGREKAAEMLAEELLPTLIQSTDILL